MPGTKIIYKQLGNGNNYREISGKFGDAASTADEKVINATGTDENLFKLVDSARVLPLELYMMSCGTLDQEVLKVCLLPSISKKPLIRLI